MSKRSQTPDGAYRPQPLRPRTGRQPGVAAGPALLAPAPGGGKAGAGGRLAQRHPVEPHRPGAELPLRPDQLRPHRSLGPGDARRRRLGGRSAAETPLPGRLGLWHRHPVHVRLLLQRHHPGPDPHHRGRALVPAPVPDPPARHVAGQHHERHRHHPRQPEPPGLGGTRRHRGPPAPGPESGNAPSATSAATPSAPASSPSSTPWPPPAWSACRA